MSIWIYILLGFFGGLVFEALLLIGFIKKIIRLGIKDKDE